MTIISKNGINRTQEQATASWIGYLYKLRIYRIREAFRKQDFNLSEAMKELNLLKLFVADKDHILGNLSTKHGEIAEHCQVNISNARNLVRGLEAEYTFNNVGRTAPEDYLRLGEFVQSKFYNGEKGTIKAIIKHLMTYPDFLKNGGSYEIPSDQYANIARIIDIYESGNRSQLSSEDMSIFRAVMRMKEESGIDFKTHIRSSVVSYEDVQVGVVDTTIENEETSVKVTDLDERKKVVNNNRPNVREAISVSLKSALLEGGIKVVIAYIQKRKNGKSLRHYSIEDWKDLGIEFSKGSAKGGVRGGVVYMLTNFTATPACLASAYVTASFGIYELLGQYRRGNLDAEQFVIYSEALTLDVSISALASFTGQVLIPIPVLGAIIGNVAGEIIFGVCKDICSKQEMELIQRNHKKLNTHRESFEKEYEAYINLVNEEMKKFDTIEELAFSEDYNIACANSILLAQEVGVSEDRILHSEDDLMHFLCD